MTMTIDGKQIEDFITLLKVILEKSGQDVSADKESLVLIRILYNIDYEVIKLISYGVNITTFYNEQLAEQIRINLTCVNAYNIMSSYKYINDAHIYEFFLQMQEIKSILGFIPFK
jgi:hypothetical protein